MKIIFPVLLCLATTLCLGGCLINGPMLSDLTFREAQVWVQTESAASVRVEYFDENNPKNTYITSKALTGDSSAFTANLTLSKVEPGIQYRYRIELNGEILAPYYSFTSPVYFHEKAPPPDVKLALAGAHYNLDDPFEPPYSKYGGAYSIFQKIYEEKPDLMLWVGNTAHIRESDQDSRSGYHKRYTKARSGIKPNALLAEIPHYAVWSSGDYGSLDAGREMCLKDTAQAAFINFWPKSGSVVHQDALCFSHRISDVELFFLDSQSQRNSNNDPGEIPQIFSSQQIEWLKQALIESKATFKLIVSGTPILNPSKEKKNFSFAEIEKAQLLEHFKTHKIEGLLFVSGGSYKGELTRIVHSSFYSFHDLTIGPSTASPLDSDSELNFFRIPGTNTFERQYATIDVYGEETDRKLKMTVFNLAGVKLWSRVIGQRELTANEDENDA